ncbi:hypothetical protein EJB05_43437, partial [Eragrostis curvula]
MASTPSCFNFLKEGALLPTRNRKLFAAVFVLAAASTSLLLLGNDLAVQPLADKLSLDATALNGTDPGVGATEHPVFFLGSPEFAHLIPEIQNDTRQLFLVGAAYSLLAVVVGSIVRIVLLFAAVATYSGELLHTFGLLLGRAKAGLKGPLVTLAFVYALEIAYAALVTALVALLVFLALNKHYYALLVAEAVVLLAACVFLVYFSFLCWLSVVVAVAEPGCRGAGAVGHAWRLMKGRKSRVVLFVAVIGAIAAVFSPVHALAKTCALSNVASGLLLGLVYSVLTAALELFAVCAMTAFYYECKGSTEASATDYVQVPDQEQVNA